MRTLKDGEKSFDELIRILPLRLFRVLSALAPQIKQDTYEIRLRQDKAVALVGAYGICFPYGQGCYSKISCENTPVVTAREIQELVYRFCDGSVYAHQHQINEGYMTYGNGYRVGMAGTAVHDGDRIKSVRDITSLNLRIVKEIPYAGLEIANKIFSDGLCSAVLIGAPMTGKTTVLRSLAGILSSAPYFYRTVLADEREELGSSHGITIDVLRAYRKTEAIERAVRSLSPQIMVCDELCNEEECEAVLKSMNNGVDFLLSVHCADKKQFLRRPLCRRLVNSACFDWFILLRGVGEPPVYYKGEDLLDEMDRRTADTAGVGRGGEVLSFQNDPTDRPA